MMLSNRPERFLKVTDPQNWKPLIDYHVMRILLRLGVVELDEAEREINRQRRWTTARSEWSIRKASYEAAKIIIQLSRRPMSFVDEKLWQSRHYCPEMTEPECSKCVFNDVCKKRVELFQPVFRTTAY
jgi:endonuclease III